MIYGYITQNCETPDVLQAVIQRYCKQKDLTLDTMVIDYESNGARWEERRLHDVVYEQSKVGDTLIAYDALSLGRSIARVVEVITTLVERGVNLHFVKYQLIFGGGLPIDALEVMKRIMARETSFSSEHATIELRLPSVKAKTQGGHKPAAKRISKLAQYRGMIQHYLDIGISKAAIARMMGCHPQTLRHYIDVERLTSQWYLV